MVPSQTLIGRVDTQHKPDWHGTVDDKGRGSIGEKRQGAAQGPAGEARPAGPRRQTIRGRRPPHGSLIGRWGTELEPQVERTTAPDHHTRENPVAYGLRTAMGGLACYTCYTGDFDGCNSGSVPQGFGASVPWRAYVSIASTTCGTVMLPSNSMSIMLPFNMSRSSWGIPASRSRWTPMAILAK